MECILIHAENEDWNLPEDFNQFPEEILLSQCASAWVVLTEQEYNILWSVNNLIWIYVGHNLYFEPFMNFCKYIF